MTTTNRPVTPRHQSSTAASSLALFGAIVTTVANFVIAGLLSVNGTQYAGVFFASTALIAIVSNAGALGTMTGQVYFMPRALDAGNPRGLVLVALGPVAVLSMVVAAAVWVAAEPVGRLVADTEGGDIADMLRILAPVIPAWALSVPLLGATRGLGTMTPTVTVNQIFKPGFQLLSIGAVVWTVDSPSAAHVAVAWGWPVLVSPALAALGVARAGGFAGQRSSPVTPGEFWTYTRPRAFSTLFQVALERFDVVLVSTFAGAGAAGVYGAITRFVTAGNFMIFALGQATSGPLRRAIAKQDWTKARFLLRQTTGWMVMITWPYFLLLAVKGQPIIEVLSPEYASGTSVLALLAMAMMVNALAGPIDLTLLMLGRSRMSLAGAAAALTVDVVLAWLLIPRMGMIGAGLAWGVAVATQNGMATWYVKRHSGLTAVARPAVIAGAGAVIAVVPIGLATPNTFTGLVLASGVAGVVYVTWMLRHSEALNLPVQSLRQASKRLSRLGG